MSFLKRHKYLVGLSSLFVIASFSIAATNTKERYADLQLFSKVLNIIEQHYVEEVDTKKLIYGGIKGMLASLDPHTNFLPPDIFKEFKSETSGEFGGVGIEISLQDDVLTVMSPIEDTPAWKAGIKGGDKVVELDGKSTKGMSLSEAVSIMRGKAGSKVTMSIWREGFEKVQKYSLEREVIKVHSVKYSDYAAGFGYVRITSFIERTGDDLIEAISKTEKKNGPLKGLVLDLRNNPGGLLDQAIKVVNEFVGEGVIVSTIGRNKKEKDVAYAKKEGARTDIPLVVLVNEYSASASEIVAGALQDHKRAIIMGTRTFGKGSVQSVVDLGDGAGLKLTIARYYTPSGRSIQAQGIEPDILVEPVDNEAYEKAVIHRKYLREADMDGHLVNESGKDLNSKDLEPASEGEDMVFWQKTKEPAKKIDESKLSPVERLKRDYQVHQAFNYLKALKVFKDMGVVSNAPVQKAAADAAPATPEKPKEEMKVQTKKIKKKVTVTKPVASPAPEKVLPAKKTPVTN